MKKGLFILAVFVMAFGNAGFAQYEAQLKSDATANVLKHYGVRGEITIVPEFCQLKSVTGEMARSTYTYDEYDYCLIEELYSLYMGGLWLDMIRISYEYDFSGNVLQKLTQMDATGTGNWMDRELVTYTYEGDELNEVVYQMMEGNDWVNKTKVVYNYNDDVTTVLYWKWNGTTWSSDELYTYSNYGTTIELIIQYMQGGAWQNDEKDTYTLDFDENVIEILVEDWEGTNWVKDKKTTYNYENYVFTSKLHEEWNGASWESTYRSSYVYDNGNATQGKCETMSEGEWVPVDGPIELTYGYNAVSINFNTCEVEAAYIDLTGVEENSQAVSFKVYPVPAENEIQIEADGLQKAEIYSVTGQKLMESTTEKMNVSALSSGLYIIKVYDLDGNSEMQRFVVK